MADVDLKGLLDEQEPADAREDDDGQTDVQLS
jgi:hypothetical protein